MNKRKVVLALTAIAVFASNSFAGGKEIVAKLGLNAGLFMQPLHFFLSKED
jgi:hypothetical protein